MSRKVFERVRANGFFRRADLWIYALVVIVAVALLLAFLLPEKEDLDAFEVTYGGERVLVCDFEQITVQEKFADNVEIEKEDGGFSVTLTTEDGVNTFFVDFGERSVWMTDADCSVSKDCTYMPSLKDDGGSIVCVPNKVKIVPLEKISSPVTG